MCYETLWTSRCRGKAYNIKNYVGTLPQSQCVQNDPMLINRYVALLRTAIYKLNEIWLEGFKMNVVTDTTIVNRILTH